MLGKLIKWEFKATCKFMLLIYGLLIAMSAVISVSTAIDLVDTMDGITEKIQPANVAVNTFAVIFIVLFVIVNLVVFSGMFFYAIKRFRDNLLGDQGYLMHTLPVKTRDHIIAKCTVSVLWTIISFFVAAIAYFILLFGSAGMDTITVIAEIIGDVFKSDYTAEILLFLAEFAILIVVSTAQSYLHIYASMAAGYSSNTHRAVKSIGIYVLISMVMSMFGSITTNLMAVLYVIEIEAAIVGHITLWASTVLGAICSVALYFVTHHFMDKKLNLL